MRKLAIILGVLFIVGCSNSSDNSSNKEWGKNLKPPTKYKEFCDRTGFEWDLTYQTEYMMGNIKEWWEVDENGDSILTMIHVHKVWTDDSELDEMEKSKIERGREIAKEQWESIKASGKGESVRKYSGE